MKRKRISPTVLSCIIITIVAVLIKCNQSSLKDFANFNFMRVILAIENRVYFSKGDFDDNLNLNQVIFTHNISESNFIPFISQKEPEQIVFDDNSVKINNQTSKTYDIDAMLKAPIDLKVQKNTVAPQILVIHTHGTESYASDENFDYEATDDRRLTDKEMSIAKIATILTDNLNESGINTVYCDEYHDYPQYNGAYSRSQQTIDKYLEQYPTIKMVIDVHRDAIISTSGEHTYTTTNIDGKECAKLMMVIGTDAGGLTHNNWQDNLNNAVNLQGFINQKELAIMRDINLRDSRFNQHSTSGSFILEVGTSGNTLTHAINAIEVFSQNLVEYLLM